MSLFCCCYACLCPSLSMNLCVCCVTCKCVLCVVCVSAGRSPAASCGGLANEVRQGRRQFLLLHPGPALGRPGEQPRLNRGLSPATQAAPPHPPPGAWPLFKDFLHNSCSECITERLLSSSGVAGVHCSQTGTLNSVSTRRRYTVPAPPSEHCRQGGGGRLRRVQRHGRRGGEQSISGLTRREPVVYLAVGDRVKMKGKERWR